MRHKNSPYKGKKSGIQRSKGLNFNKHKRKWNLDRVKEIIIWIAEIMLVFTVASLLVFYLGIRIPVVGPSMSGTLESGEVVLVNRFVYQLFQPKANDIIVFLPNGNDKSHYYIKRVIAVPGDTVQITEGVVYVNGEPFEEKIENPQIENGLLAEDPIEVGEDEYFVLGDNRNNSEDSRYANIGNVKKEHIEGKAWLIVSPLSKCKMIR